MAAYNKGVEPSLASGDDAGMKVINNLFLLIAALLTISLPLSAEESAKTTADAPTPSSTERQLLKAGSDEFLSLYRPTQSRRLDGGVILLHDRGAHPDWPGVIQTLRRELPIYGWSTLSIELPAIKEGADPSASIKEWLDSIAARIEAALLMMGERNIFNIVLIGHGSGATIAADYMIKKPSDRIQGLIAIGMDGSKTEAPSLDGAMLLRGLNKRIFDIYGSRDFEAVVRSAKRRKTIATTAEPGKKSLHLRAADIARGFNQQSAKEITYRQHRVEGADHQFWGYEQQLLNRVVGWLRRYAASSSIKISREK